MPTDFQKKQNTAIRGFLELLKFTDYEHGITSDLKYELNKLTKDEKFLELLLELKDLVTVKNVIQPNEVTQYSQLDPIEKRTSKSQMSKSIKEEALAKRDLEQKNAKLDEQIKKTKSDISKLENQIKFLDAELNNDDQAMRFSEMDKQNHITDLCSDYHNSIDYCYELLERIEKSYTVEANHILGSKSDCILVGSTPIEKILSAEEKNFSAHKKSAKKDFTEIVDLLNFNKDKMSPLSFYDDSLHNDTQSLIELNPEKHRLLNSVRVSILGYAPRKEKLTMYQAELAKCTAVKNRLEKYLDDGKFLFELKADQSVVTELEDSVKRKRKAITLKSEELNKVLHKAGKLEREELLAGEYRQKLAKSQLLNKKQAEVKCFLVDQFSCLYVTLMLLKFDTSQIEAKTNAMASLVELLRSQQTDTRQRLKYLDNLQSVADSKRNSELIRPENMLMTIIHDNLVYDDGSGFGMRSFSSALDASKSMMERRRKIESSLTQLNSHHPDTANMKDLLEKLCPKSEDGQTFNMQMSDETILVQLPQASQQFDQIKENLVPIFQKVEQERSKLGAHRSAAEEKYAWVEQATRAYHSGIFVQDSDDQQSLDSD